MNRRLTEPQIRATCREFTARGMRISGRQLRRELENRFGAKGKTDIVFKIWREETEKLTAKTQASALPTEVAELQRRLRLAEATAAELLKRAELAEYREQAHQDHWALEIEKVRRELEEARRDNAAGQGASRPFPV
jgi:hypothetical protein